MTREASGITVRFESIANTRFEKAIGLKIDLAAIRDYRYNPPEGPGTCEGLLPGRETVREGSPIFWLPAPDKVTPAEAIDLILRQRYGLKEEARRPTWARGYTLPTEEAIKIEIAGLEMERLGIVARISEARERAANAAGPSLLLYEKGKHILEPIVRETLRRLGAHVEDPEAEGIEDGTLTRPEGLAILEIKGRVGPIKQDDVRQVVQWASDAKLRDDIEYKPIILGNPYCEVAPGERGEPFSPPAKTYAENGGVALVTTVQLYEALRQKQVGELDENAFWKSIFEAKGLADLPSPVTLSLEDHVGADE